MKWKTKSYFIVAALIGLIIICSFIPFNNKRQVVVKEQLYDVAKQINDLNNWKRWNVDLKNDDIKISESYNTDQTAIIDNKQSYLLHHINPIAVSLIRTVDNDSSASIISLSPSPNDSATVVTWSENITIFEIVKRNITHVNSRQDNLDSLKTLMEDVNHKYGFFIRLIPVKDTLILTAESPGNDSSNIISHLYRQLQEFIIENKLPAEKNYFYTTQLSDNKIAVGIPVYKQLNNTENIKFLQLPGNGRLVEGSYSGSISGKRPIYTAINNFMLDQHLKQVAQPLEQYNVADTILNLDKNINLKIYYPVF